MIDARDDPFLSHLAGEVSIGLNDNERNHWDFMKAVPFLQAAAILYPSNHIRSHWSKRGWTESVATMVLEGLWLSRREYDEREKLGLDRDEDLPEDRQELIEE
ncbi:hypothetical protein SARC_03649 [Sphaeroforma arctica JP610]|uniref:Uncharacterized protein n=1 Tax=Sphaeroforma arctica JP610 TaxID=667725 RepID=A0A0L0G7E2_9EUKA|nr:hypothetical protein SARC_03649 [Sphaeroforma arctica JP610]KNC84128.1 hypothetical protein SARC_03649 [Sphaeroforma arctica JP610]|eukprot:XP_014158030.1 hypothetical protein SARC_03649 [Sphaeroforma arctica JP610]